MSRISVSVEVEDNLDNFLKLLPLAIRSKYMTSVTSAAIKQNEKQIISDITGITQEVLQIAISPRDEQIIQEELDKALEKIGVIMEPAKKTIKGKKNSEEFKRKEAIESPIEQTVFTQEVYPLLEKIESIDSPKAEEKQAIENNEQELPLVDHKIEVKKLDLENMFARENEQ